MWIYALILLYNFALALYPTTQTLWAPALLNPELSK